MSEFSKDSVERTLCIPLWSRAIAVKKLPSILPDIDSVRILDEMGERRPPSILYNLECAALAGAIRQYDFACEIKEYLEKYPGAVIVELGAGLSCLRRQMKNETNTWINIDFPEVIACREKYIPTGEKEINIVSDITNHAWFEKIPFQKEDGIIFLAAGVLHYLTYNDVKELIDDMAKSFPGGVFIFDFVSEKGKSAGIKQIEMTDNNTKISFSMENAEKEIGLMSPNVKKVIQKSYFEGYPVENVHYNWITRLYIRSKRDKYYVVHVEF